MSLRTRLLLFVQGTLAIVLVGFSTALYLLAAFDLNRQTDDRLEAALNTLAAAAEINDSSVEWEPEDRTVSFSRRAVEDGFLWRVANPRGRTLDGSSKAKSHHIFDEWDTNQSQFTRIDDSGRPWRVAQRLLEPPRRDRDESADESSPPFLRLSAAVAVDGIDATLNRLAGVLAGLSAGLWIATLVLGDRLCRRILKPLAQMADAAREIGAERLDDRLPVPQTHDAIEDLGRSFNALLDRLQESFERQRRFTGDASHQLRTPLTAIQGQVDLALRQPRDPQEYQRVLTLVQKRARHLHAIVESLLFLARTDAEALRPNLTVIDLNEWTADYARSRPESAKNAPIELRFDDHAPHEIRAQPALLGVLLDNLIDNAERYGPPGSPVRVDVGRDASRVIVQVTDQGPGIAPDDLPRLFEPFYRAPAVRDSPIVGSGLGLSIVDRLARAFQATIRIHSRPGQGTTFTLAFPIAGHPQSIPNMSTTITHR